MIPDKPFLNLRVDGENDVIIVRRRTKQFGQLLGMAETEQTRIATAVAEIARNAFQYAGGAEVIYFLDDGAKQYFGVSIKDKGPGIDNLESYLSSDPNLNRGLQGARSLVDRFDIDSDQNGTVVNLRMLLSLGTQTFTTDEIREIGESFSKPAEQTPIDEVYSQNKELLEILTQLQAKQDQIEELMLREKELNFSLNNQVQARTNNLESERDNALEANSLKSQFVSNVSHELRSPLSSVVGLAELLATSNQLSPDDSELAMNLLDSSKKLLAILNNLLDFTKRDIGEMTIESNQFSPRELLAEVMSRFQEEAQRRSVMIFLETSFDVPERCFGDERKIMHILTSLTSNALKNTFAGSVKLSVQVESTGSDSVKLKMSVTDTGIGIASDRMKVLFQPFAPMNGSSQKTGFGLSLTRSYVNLLGGEIGVVSELKQGSTFWFTVPLQCEHTAACQTK